MIDRQTVIYISHWPCSLHIYMKGDPTVRDFSLRFCSVLNDITTSHYQTQPNAASASPGKWKEIQILRHYLEPTKSETLAVGPGNLLLN